MLDNFFYTNISHHVPSSLVGPEKKVSTERLLGLQLRATASQCEDNVEPIKGFQFLSALSDKRSIKYVREIKDRKDDRWNDWELGNFSPDASSRQL